MTNGEFMSRLYSSELISELSVKLYVAAGARPDEARATVTSLITSSLMGHDSHGVIRIPEYQGHSLRRSEVYHREAKG